METFTEPKGLVQNQRYNDQRQRTLAGLNEEMIDVPIVNLITTFNKLPYCFTLQSCYGHFLYKSQNNLKNLDSLPITNNIARVAYRIAYIVFCVENNASGIELLEVLKKMTAIDPENIQLCCAEWFWKQQVNSYALQAVPDRFKHKDRAILDYREALHIEKIRNEFFLQLQELLQKQIEKKKPV